jgi:mRNA interferase RelE/StbE
MRYEIVLAEVAVDDLANLRPNIRAEVRSQIEEHLRHQPTKVSKSRIKRLKGISRPQYRLRIGDVRVFYDVSDDVVEVLAVVAKSEANNWLEKHGENDEKSGTV